MLSYKQANVPIAIEAAQSGAAAQRERDAARAGACGGARGLDRRRSRSRARRLGADPERASARRAGVSPRAFQQFLARAAGRDARLGRAREAEMGRATCRATARSSPVIASRWRSAATTRPPSPRAAPRSRSIRATSGARMRSRTSWRCRAATPKASRGSTSWSGIGRAATTCCIICGGTARCFISSGASSTRCSISTTSASAISAAR